MALAPTALDETVGNALTAVDEFMGRAEQEATAKHAAEWSLAAKNAAAVVLAVEQVRKTIHSPKRP